MKELFELKIEEKPYKEIMTIMNNVKELNEDNEIGAWLIGKWKKEKDMIKATIKEIHIPKQEVSGTEIDISPKSMSDTIKELGVKKCRDIIGHWHIHPFSSGETNWSSTDEEKIKDWMNPTKGRELFIFALSSKTMLKGRVEMNMNAEIKGLKVVVSDTVDDLKFKVEKNAEETKLLNEIKKNIKLKVETKKYNWKKVNTDNNWGKWDLEDKNKESLKNKFQIKTKKGEIEIIIKKRFGDFIRSYPFSSKEILEPNIIKEHKKVYSWKYNTTKEKLDRIKERFEEELIWGQVEYRKDDMMNEEEKQMNKSLTSWSSW